MLGWRGTKSENLTLKLSPNNLFRKYQYRELGDTDA